MFGVEFRMLVCDIKVLNVTFLFYNLLLLVSEFITAPPVGALRFSPPQPAQVCRFVSY